MLITDFSSCSAECAAPSFVVTLEAIGALLTTATEAEPNALEALARLLARLPAFGQFRTRNEIDGPTVEARLSKAQAEKAQAYLDAPEFATMLRAELAEIALEARKAAEQEQDRERIVRLSPFEFGKLIEKRSAGRLQQMPWPPEFSLTCKDLLPVTHFKALARLTTYDSKAKTFTVAAHLLHEGAREKLLKLSATIARSTKKVTAADIALRRKNMKAKAAAQSEWTWEKIEDMVIDMIGFTTPENMREMANILGASPTGPAPWTLNAMY